MLKKRLRQIEGRGYKAYKNLEGDYDFGTYFLHIDNVQSDPFAPPSRLRVTVKQDKAKLPYEMYSTPVKRVALEDYLTRRFARAISLVYKSGKSSGTGKSGLIAIDHCGQEILERSSMQVDKDQIQARFVMGLPAKGRTVQAAKAEAMFFEKLPRIVDKALLYENLNKDAVRKHINIAEDQEILRELLIDKGLVAFIGNGAILPRESGVSDQPLSKDKAVQFKAPAELEVSFNLPHQKEVRGMGIPEGVSLIIGGGYHGKSTLLKALERGVYNHIPGDGRELTVSLESSFKIRAEDGRSVAGVDIEPFINNLPFGAETRSFSSENASGSTSQAANIMEGLESGASLLLLDEDTSATNFMIRDGRMQHLVAKENEPITPFIDQVQEIFKSLGVSTILVLGGSGDYFDIADNVIMIKEYLPHEVTAKAQKVAAMYKNERQSEVKSPIRELKYRVPLRESFFLSPRGKVKSRGIQSIIFDREHINLSYVEQLVDESQTRAIAEIFRILGQKEMVDNKISLSELVDHILHKVSEKGIDIISPYYGKHPGELALPRKQEICAAINRFRKLRIK